MSTIITEIDGRCVYYPEFLKPERSNQLYEVLFNETPWQQDEITLFGKKHLIPRRQALYAVDQSLTYRYSGHTITPLALTPTLQFLLEKINSYFDLEMNAILLNLYENGQHSNGWHADDEKELGQNPIIVSVSLGATRNFLIKHNQTKEKHKIELEHGSALLMEGSFQRNWKHTIPKTKKPVGPRINLTFRQIRS